MPYLIIIALIGAIIGLYYQNEKLKNKNQQIVRLNAERKQQNEQIEEELGRLRNSYKEKRQELNSIQDDIDKQNKLLCSLTESAEALRENAEKQAEQSYDSKMKELEVKYEEREGALSAEYQSKLNKINEEIARETQKLQDLEAKQLAYIQAQQRQEEIDSNSDYYRLAIDELELNDVTLLRELQPRFLKKESIDKLIWEVYYKPAFDALVGRLFTGASKICGIYRITDQTTGQSYIGQSVDCKERWRQHIKTGLTYGKATNKLYQAMKKSGLNNFTFEILEEVPRDKLNEREIYWINLYKTKDIGLNKTAGGS